VSRKGAQYQIDTRRVTSCVILLPGCSQEPNVRYLSLETLSRLALVPDVLEAIRHHQPTVVASLRVSVCGGRYAGT
jgi:hypothetical protein